MQGKVWESNLASLPFPCESIHRLPLPQHLSHWLAKQAHPCGAGLRAVPLAGLDELDRWELTDPVPAPGATDTPAHGPRDPPVACRQRRAGTWRAPPRTLARTCAPARRPCAVTRADHLDCGRRSGGQAGR